MFARFMAWLRRPPKRDRILAVLADAREPLLGREIAKRAGLGFVGPYTELHRLEAEGLVSAKPAPEHTVYFGQREIIMRVYWLTNAGRRARVGAPDSSLSPLEAL